MKSFKNYLQEAVSIAVKNSLNEGRKQVKGAWTLDIDNRDGAYMSKKKSSKSSSTVEITCDSKILNSSNSNICKIIYNGEDYGKKYDIANTGDLRDFFDELEDDDKEPAPQDMINDYVEAVIELLADNGMSSSQNE